MSYIPRKLSFLNSYATALVLSLVTPAIAQQASLTLTKSDLVISQTNNTEWTLTKESLVGDALATNTGQISWNVTATRGETSAAMLTVYGYLAITNSGTADATIGNIVINLQRTVAKKWQTVSSDIASATLGDAATSAVISAKASSEGLGQFTENAASGALNFTDANNNTIFSITPQSTIAPGATVTLVFRAGFDNSVLGITAGESVRTEAIVTFGNSGSRGGSGASSVNLDINGNGVLDADEANVRSVPARYTSTVPALVRANDQVLLTDAGVTSTGDATTSGFDGAGAAAGLLISTTTSINVTVQADGGVAGGAVTNTATLVGGEVTTTLITGYETVLNPDGSTSQLPLTTTFTTVPAVDASATSTVLVPGLDGPPPPPPPSVLNPGDFATFTQGGWGAAPNGNNPGTLLTNNFAAVFGSGCEVGLPGATGFSMKFATASALTAYLPAGGTAASLTVDLLNPATSSAGVFGGQVTALHLNVAFSLAGVTAGDLASLKFAATGTMLDGLTVGDVLALCESALGGNDVSGLGIAYLNSIATELNEAFDNGTQVTQWAQDHLVR